MAQKVFTVLASLSALLVSTLAFPRISPDSDSYLQQYAPAAEQKHEAAKQIPIVKQIYEQKNGLYRHSYETGHGIHVQELGFFKDSGEGEKSHPILVQQGAYSYPDEHGNMLTVHYIADENGFQPQGAHLPTPPAVPEDIAKAQSIVHPQPEQHSSSLNEHSSKQQYTQSKGSGHYSNGNNLYSQGSKEDDDRESMILSIEKELEQYLQNRKSYNNE